MWLSNLFGNSGVNGFANLSCTNLTHRAGDAERRAPAAEQLQGRHRHGRAAGHAQHVDPNLHFPETWRSSIGYDRRLPWNMIGTIEGIYTRGVYNFYYRTSTSSTEPDRHRRQRPPDVRRHHDAHREPGAEQRPAPTLGDVFEISNTKTHDYSYSITEQIVKRFSNNFEGQVAYTYSRSYDVWDVTSSVAQSNWQFGRSYSGRQDAQDLVCRRSGMRRTASSSAASTRCRPRPACR